jgi:hypothetical protein
MSTLLKGCGCKIPMHAGMRLECEPTQLCKAHLWAAIERRVAKEPPWTAIPEKQLLQLQERFCGWWAKEMHGNSQKQKAFASADPLRMLALMVYSAPGTGTPSTLAPGTVTLEHLAHWHTFTLGKVHSVLRERGTNLKDRFGSSKTRLDRVSATGAIVERNASSDANAPMRWDSARYADLRDKTDWQHGFKPPYRTIIGDTPKLGPGCLEENMTEAKAFLYRVEQAQDHGGLTKSEGNKLRELHKIWTRRAYGQDARFMALGNRCGGTLSAQDEEKVRFWQRLIDIDNRTHPEDVRLRNNGREIRSGSSES